MKKIENLGKVKKRNMLLVLIMGICLYFVSLFSEQEKVISDKGTISRNSYSEGYKNVTVNVINSQYGIDKELDLKINERKYSDEEIESFSIKLDQEIEKIILNENTSPDEVKSSLYFPDKIDGYPFKLQYTVSDSLLIDRNGQIDYERLKDKDPEDEGVLLSVDVKYMYDEYTKIYSFFIVVYSRDLSFEELFDEALMEKINTYDEKYKAENYFVLPSQVGGIELTYHEKKKNTGLIIFLITLFLMILTGIMTDKEYKDDIDKRNNEMLSDYPRIVNKFTLYYDAGIPVKAIWKRICDEYKKEKEKTGKRREVYELMILSEIEIKEGKSEIESYENFVKRCGLSKYRGFISLLEQIVVKGKKDVSMILKDESIQAFNERKINGKRMLEEASTKLLIPMFMMLLIVIVMIIYPAFLAFR